MNVSKIELVYNPNQDPQLYTPVVLTASLLAKDSQLIKIESSKNKIQNSISSVDLVIDSKPLNQQLKSFSLCQLLIQLVNKPTDLYSSADALKIQHFVDLVDSKQDLNDLTATLNDQLVNQKYLVGSNLTLADLFIWSRFAYQDSDKIDALDRTKKWFRRLENDLKSAIHLLALYKPKIVKDAPKQPKTPKEKKATKGGINEEAKYVDLKDAKDGEVVVRFPPEASGYLHIGHAKAALLNQFYQVKFNGKLVFRFDDTNPEKEKEDFEKVIREDVEMLQIKPDICSYTSDYFDLYLEKCEYLIKQGKAYVDDTEPEQMKQEREQRIESKNRNNSVEKNLEMWNEMKKGTEFGQKCCVRAKMDMKSNNGCLRDPALYRCKNAPHPRTGNKYKVYPTYDFACPIVDSIEGVTHSLRTTEYLDRDPQFNWIIDALNLRKVNIADYSRLNMQHVVLSKRKLTWFVQNKIVSGWDDPRMPTVRGILRRGLTVDGLREFIIAQGSSRSIVFMEWDKIWNFNRKIIDPKAVRYMGIEKLNSVKVNVDNLDLNEIEVDCNPKNPELKKRKMKVSKQLLIDQIDAAEIKENEFVTFMNLGNIFINKVVKENGLVKEINGKFDPNNKDFKKTLKVTWLDSTNVIDAQCYYYENLIEKPVLDKDDEFKDYINKESEIKVDFLVEKEMINLKKSDIIQILRKGYFICDEPYDKKALSHTSLDGKINLFSIPDGTTDLACYPEVVKEAKLRLKEKIKKFAEKKPTVKTLSNQPSSADDLIAKHEELAATVRRLKEEAKTNKSIDFKPELAKLIEVKKQYKELTGKDIPSTTAQSSKSTPQQQQQQQSSSSADNLIAKHEELAATVRRLKEEAKTNKSIDFKPELAKLIEVKKEYKELTGKDIPSTTAQSSKSTPQQKPKQKEEKPKKQQQPAPESSQIKKKQTKLGMEYKKSENFSEWYTEVITKSEMIDYYDISGCYVLWEWSFGIWEKITEYLDGKIKEEGVKNVGFPLFVSKSSLEVEEDHISDFAPEVAWVTKSGQSDLQEPIAIRPTSETVMYPYFAKRIKSHRDLPLKVNQWCNVVRWEFKDPTPFLRTREFYWQEGHTAHATSEEALKEVYKILDHYASVYEYLLAIPVIKGKKTNKEKFAGGDMTTTIEGYISENGKGIQAATSHFLGQNFAKMFKICFQDEKGSSKEKQLVYQNSWGFTTRSIGVMVMEHSDDKGLVLPPRISPIQVVIIPCGIKVDTKSEDKEKLFNTAEMLEQLLLGANIKAKLDTSEHQTVGWKFNHYELKGVPVRIEIGFNDLSKKECVAIRRDTLEKKTISLSESTELISKLLDDIQNDLFEKAKKKRDAKLRFVKSMDEFNQHLNDKCLILAAFCGNEQCEETIKKETASNDAQGLALMGAKSLCIPFKPEELISDIKDLDANSKCINSKCELKPQFYTLFGRSY